MPFLMSVWPTVRLNPFALQEEHDVRERRPAMRHEISRPLQRRVEQRRDRLREPDLRRFRAAAGFGLGGELRFGAGFLDRREREGSCLGGCSSTLWMFASPAPCVSLTDRLAPWLPRIALGAQGERGLERKPRDPPPGRGRKAAPPPRAPTLERRYGQAFAARRVEGEMAAAHVHDDRANIEGDSVEDRGNRVGPDRDLRGLRVDVEG